MAHPGHNGVSNGTHGQDGYRTVHFSIKYVTYPGDFLVICGSLPEFGGWELSRAFKMKWGKDHVWTAELRLPPSVPPFEYKYVALHGRQPPRWEAGPNRIVDFAATEGGERVEVTDAFDHLRVRFSIYYVVPDGQRVCVTGDMDEIGRWTKGTAGLSLGPPRTLRTGARERNWELELLVPRGKYGDIQYRYSILNERTKKAEMWEREPNRRTNLVEAQMVNGVYDTHDVNFVAGMKFDYVPDNMFIGPYPQRKEDLDAMKEAGVTAVLNVQTMEDIHQRQIPWPELQEHYRRIGIKLVHYPIYDFNPEDLRRRLKGAVKEWDTLLAQGHKAYVHCTAGMGRAPAVVVAYLCWKHKMDPDAACAHVKAYRTVAVPNMGIIRPLVTGEPY
eukprot:tig00021719_g23167.t1